LFCKLFQRLLRHILCLFSLKIYNLSCFNKKLWKYCFLTEKNFSKIFYNFKFQELYFISFINLLYFTNVTTFTKTLWNKKSFFFLNFLKKSIKGGQKNATFISILSTNPFVGFFRTHFLPQIFCENWDICFHKQFSRIKNRKNN